MMLEMVKLYLQYGPTDAPEKNHTPSAILVKAARVLEYVTRVAPGFIEALYLLATVKFLSGAIDSAKNTVQYVAITAFFKLFILSICCLPLVFYGQLTLT